MQFRLENIPNDPIIDYGISMNEDIPKSDYLSCIGYLFQLVWR